MLIDSLVDSLIDQRGKVEVSKSQNIRRELMRRKRSFDQIHFQFNSLHFNSFAFELSTWTASSQQ